MGFYRHLGLCFSHLPRVLLAEDGTHAPTSPSPFPPPSPKSSLAPFRPSIAVIVGVLTTMFSITFLLLLYAKHCKRSAVGYGGNPTGPGFPTSSAGRRNSGVERAVIESLPVFRFGSLRGQKDGLECAVCLTRFEPAEVLRLLPKCKHAFHVECVDTWLDAHSTCPLCRYRVDPEDVLLVHDLKPHHEPEAVPVTNDEKGRDTRTGDDTVNPFKTRGGRISGRHSSAGERSSNSLQIVVHRVDPDQSRSRRSVDYAALRDTGPAKAVGCFERGRKDGLLLTETADKEAIERRFGHRIIVSEGDGTQERWSDLRPSDLLFLRSEMIITESGRYSVSRVGRTSCSSSGGAAAGGSSVINSRSVSEITGVRRFPINGVTRRQTEERTLSRWMGFAANRTARWLGNRGGGNGPNTYPTIGVV